MQTHQDNKSQSLSKSAAKGIGYLGVSSVVSNVIRLFALAVLARNLTAADFGIAFLSIIVIRLVQENSAFGIETLVIQKKNLTNSQINRCFCGSLIFALISWVALILVAPLIAWAMNIGEIGSTLRLLSFVIIISWAGMIPRSLLERELNYGKVALFEALAQATAYVSAVILLYKFDIGYWALIWGFLFSELIKTIGYCISAGWLPKLNSLQVPGKNTWRFGLNVTIDRVLTYGSLNIDRILIGGLLGASAVGLYSLAFELIAFPAKRLSALLGRVLFPSLSSLQDNSEVATQFYLKSAHYISILTVPALIGLAIVAPELSNIIYGDKGSSIALLIQLLCPAGVVFAVLTPSGSLFYSKGRPDISAKWSLLTLMIVIVFVSIGGWFGLHQAASAMSLAWVILFFIMQILIAQISQIEIFEAYKPFMSTIMTALIVGTSAILFKYFIAKFLIVGDLWILLSTIFIGTFIFILFILTTERQILKWISLQLKSSND